MCVAPGGRGRGGESVGSRHLQARACAVGELGGLGLVMRCISSKRSAMPNISMSQSYMTLRRGPPSIV